MGKKINLELGEDYIEIIKAEKCNIRGCKEYATHNMCTLKFCKKHYDQARD